MEKRPTISLPPTVYPHLSDRQLVEFTCLGLTDAYDELVRRYRAAVCLTAARFVRPDSAQDVAQEVFLAAFHALAQLEDPARFGGWLRAIARHRAERWGRRERRQSPTESPVLERHLQERSTAENDGNPERLQLEEERKHAILCAIRRLSENHREVILLHYHEEWPLARIAAYLSVSETVVRGRLFRARAALRALLTEERK
ncbi:MAG: sigma-70 family RNA polymerase sigma factor [Capsulimonadales bacterium]|nr:sigma-70 family RNA polymerase sigma factor [Capsulimonadales bacterium]